MKKFLWIICLILFSSMAGMLIFKLVQSKTPLKKVAGIATNLPSPDPNALIKPPVKSANYSEPHIYSKASLLMDAPSSYVIYQKSADLKVPIASTTKIMTATVVLDNYGDHLDDVVTITRPMVAIEGSDIQLRIGEKIKVIDLLKGLLIMSGNDTAYSLALHFGGKDAFIKEMNDKAAFLGLSSTRYQCPAGLNDDGYSTAQDLAFLTNYALKNPTFSSIVSTPSATISSVDGKIIHELKNSNRMLQTDDSNFFSPALGVKTGFTYAAGHCLVSSAKKDGHQLIGIILNTNENTITASAKESKKLMEWGFANWDWN